MSECYCGVDHVAEDAARGARKEAADSLALADALAEAAESLAIESEGREFPFDLHPYVRGVVEAAKRYRESRR